MDIKTRYLVVFLVITFLVISSAPAMYCSKAGRFLQHDPVGTIVSHFYVFNPILHGSSDSGLNMYVSMNNNPILVQDAFGLWGSNVHNGDTSPKTSEVFYGSKWL